MQKIRQTSGYTLKNGIKNWKRKSHGFAQKTVSLFRMFETKTSWFRPDLSYIPKEK